MGLYSWNDFLGHLTSELEQLLQTSNQKEIYQSLKIVEMLSDTRDNTCTCGFQHSCCNPISPSCLPCVERRQETKNLLITAKKFLRNS